MMNVRNVGCAVLTVAFLLLSGARAERFTVYGAYSVPGGAFASFSSDLKKGNATSGFGGGLEFSYPLKEERYDVLLVAGYYSNPIDEEVINTYLDESYGYGEKISSESWKLIQILTGLRFNGEADPSIDVYLQLMGGVGVVDGASMTIPAPYTYSIGLEPDELKYDCKTSVVPVFGFGAGLVVSKRFDLGLRYLNFGSPDFHVDRNSMFPFTPSQEACDSETIDVGISILVLTAGIRF